MKQKLLPAVILTILAALFPNYSLAQSLFLSGEGGEVHSNGMLIAERLHNVTDASNFSKDKIVEIKAVNGEFRFTVKNLSTFVISDDVDDFTIFCANSYRSRFTNVNESTRLETENDLDRPLAMIKRGSFTALCISYTPWIGEYTFVISANFSTLTLTPNSLNPSIVDSKIASLSTCERPHSTNGWYDINGDGKLEFLSPVYMNLAYGDSNYGYLMGQFDENLKPESPGLQLHQSVGQVKYPTRVAADLPIMSFSLGGLNDRVPYSGNLYALGTDYSVTEHSAPEGLASATDNYFYFIDYDNSGRKGLINKGSSAKDFSGLAYRINPDLSYTDDSFEILSWNEYNNIRSDMSLSRDSNPLGSYGSEMFGRDGGGKTYTSLTTADINGDGLPDIIDGSTGFFLLNTGLGSYVKSTFGGQTEIRDLNGDGISDLVIYDSANKKVDVQISRPGQDPVTKTVMQNYPMGRRVWCYDFDHDGDVDILVPVNYQSALGGGFLLLMINDGNGNFKISETYIDGDVTFLECRDVNADGDYEVLAFSRADGYPHLNGYAIKGTFVNTNPITIYSYGEDPNLIVNTCFLANLNNSGRTYLLGGKLILQPSEAINERPVAPSAPIFTFNPLENQLKVNWAAGSDKESSAADLTYEIRIGTAPGLDDIMAADANADGTRRTMQPGANGYLRHRTFDVSSWPAGKYYISVQSVDPNMLGSAFSEYSIFEKKAPAAGFAIGCPETKAAGDILTLRLKSKPEQGVTYSWNLDGAQVVEATADNTTLKVRFLTGGRKNISLTATAPDNTQAVFTRVINLDSSSLTFDKSSNFIYHTFDLDADGSEEAYSNITYFSEQDAEGNITGIKKMYNTNLSISNVFTAADFNRDGLVDIFTGGGNYSNSQLIYNNEDKNLTFSNQFKLSNGIDNNYWQSELGDFNFDGSLEAIYTSKNAYIEYNDDFTVKRVTPITLEKGGYIDFVYDFNRDGLPDIISSASGGDWQNPRYVYLSNGDGTFTTGEALPQEFYEEKPGDFYEGWRNPVYIADIDFDGLPDYIYNRATYAFASFYEDRIHVKFGNGRKLDILCPDGDPFDYTMSVFDIDNNGMADIIVKDKVIYFDKDYSYSISSYNNYYTLNPHCVGATRMEGTDWSNSRIPG